MLVAFIILVTVTTVNGYGENCCDKATGNCRLSCQQLFLPLIPDLETKQQRELDVRNFCSSSMVAFWACYNQTKTKDEQIWKECCKKAETEKCHKKCKKADSPEDLSPHCRRSDETIFFKCVQEKLDGEECCGLARKPECLNVCRQWVLDGSVSKHKLVNTCTSSVLNCVSSLSTSVTAAKAKKYIPCCDKAVDAKCKSACREALKRKTTDDEVMNHLMDAGCGPVTISNEMWQCFLKDKLASIEMRRAPNDVALLHCCRKSPSTACRDSCMQVFDGKWDEYNRFKSDCLSSADGQELSQCIDEVGEPCEVGCGGLSFCSQFNNRPNELFRSCNADADNAASSDINHWKHQNFILLPSRKKVYIKNITDCSPIAWQTIICMLQIKPCDRLTHVTEICVEDCYKILNSCINWKRTKKMSITDICEELTQNKPNTTCVSVDPFLLPTDEIYTDDVSRPCRKNMCSPGEICVADSNCRATMTCPIFKCIPGCSLGEASQLSVPLHTYIRAPRKLKHVCYEVCQCSPQGTINERCISMSCYSRETCTVGNDKYEHGSSFYIDCNICACFDGEVTCGKKQCPVNGIGVINTSYTTLPCNCPVQFEQVCGRNGVTYPNPCIARCLGLSEAEYTQGSCTSIDPCSENPCSEPNSFCLPKRQACLSITQKCPQYICVTVSPHCGFLPHDVVCSKDGITYNHSCLMIEDSKELAYFGECITCDSEHEICGADGNTYASECDAVSRNVLIDYAGPCLTTSAISTTSSPSKDCSKLVTCPPLFRENCTGYTPPGACCPKCGGALRILFSQKQISRIFEALNYHRYSVSAEAILESLKRHVQVAECTVRGQITMENDLLVMVIPVVPNPSTVQMLACELEAEKLTILIQRLSPRIVVELSLSTLITANFVHYPISSAATFTSFSTIVLSVALSAESFISFLNVKL